MARRLSRELDPAALRLREARVRQGWTQDDLVEQVKRVTGVALSVRTIKEYERGAGKPSVKTIALVEAAVGLADQARRREPGARAPIVHRWMPDWDIQEISDEIRGGIKNGNIHSRYSPRFFTPISYQARLNELKTGLQYDCIMGRDRVFSEIKLLIASRIKNARGVDIVSLSEAYGWPEVDLSKCLADYFSDGMISLSIISNSMFVLNSARLEMEKLCRKYSNVKMNLLLGNHECIGNYRDDYLFANDNIRVIVVPSVFVNWCDDVLLFRSISMFSRNGDYLMFDIVLPYSDIAERSKTLTLDPRLNGCIDPSIRTGSLNSMVSGVIEHSSNCFAHSGRTELYVPEARISNADYAVSYIVTVNSLDNDQCGQDVCVMKFMRHDSRKLVDKLKQLHWRCIGTWKSDDCLSPIYLGMSMLFQRF